MTNNSEAHLLEHYGALGNFDRDFRNNNLFRLASDAVEGERVVDIGSGAGHFSDLLLKKGKEVFAIEPNAGLVELTRRKHPDLHVIEGTAEELERLIPAPVDSVCMLDVLEHIEKDEEQVRKISSVLAPAGQFIVVVPAYPSLYGIRDEEMGHFRRYTKQSLREVLTRSGFEVVEMRYWNALGVLPYLVSEKILKKPLRVKLREEAPGLGKQFAWTLVNTWMREIENRVSFGFGLSIICIARKV